MNDNEWRKIHEKVRRLQCDIQYLLKCNYFYDDIPEPYDWYMDIDNMTKDELLFHLQPLKDVYERLVHNCNMYDMYYEKFSSWDK